MNAHSRRYRGHLILLPVVVLLLFLVHDPPLLLFSSRRISPALYERTLTTVIPGFEEGSARLEMTSLAWIYGLFVKQWLYLLDRFMHFRVFTV